MNTLPVQLRYRPLRLGWCVLKGDMEAVRRAIRMSFTLWGGSFNPIIPVDDPHLARTLVTLYRVDALIGMSADSTVDQFVREYRHLPWPMVSDGLMIDMMRLGKTATIADIRHPLARLHDENVRNNPSAEPSIDMHQWDDTDPLADVFLFTYGAYPPAHETGEDYAVLARTSLIGVPHLIPNGSELTAPRIERMTISSISRAYTMRHHAIRNYWDSPGFYVGKADRFDDLMTFWNLRAADVHLEFFDASYADRMSRPIRHWTGRIRDTMSGLYEPDGIALWHLEGRDIGPAERYFSNEDFTPCSVGETTWRGMNVRVPIMYFADTSVLASVDANGRKAAISFSVTNKPFIDSERSRHQHYVMSVVPDFNILGNDESTLRLPFIPELNEYYGLTVCGTRQIARSEPDGLGIVSSCSSDHQWLNALNVQELITKTFESVGVDATPSKPGRVASTLIRQMGGLAGCWPFRISGVRTLIEKHRPDQSFSRSTAMQTINGQGGDRSLSDYQWLRHIADAPGGKLTNDAVLSCLLEKGVFRAGLKFHCPSCQLESWRSLDEARARLECDYCGHGFNVTPQLRDKDWAFRRSGLFGNDDHQQGAIPVLLTLQQLKIVSRMKSTTFATAMNLKTRGSTILSCETDFVVMSGDGKDRPIEIAIGECKTRQRISKDDVDKLATVADAFPSDRYSVYVVFARLTPFSEAEVDLIKQINHSDRVRAIMLTERELEPSSPYERTATGFDVKENATSFEEMATVTSRVFLGG